MHATAARPRKLLAFLHSTLDGFIANSAGEFWMRFPWGEEEMQWNNEQFRQADTWVLGRKMYEAIVPWWESVAGSLDVRGGPRSDDRRGAAVERLPLLIVDAVVVGAQKRSDDRARACRPVAEGLAGEHRRQLHDAGSLFSTGVSAARQPDRLVARGTTGIGIVNRRPDVDRAFDFTLAPSG